MGYKNKMAKIIPLPISDSLGSINPHPKNKFVSIFIKECSMEICLGYQLHIYAHEIYNPQNFILIISYKSSGKIF